MRIVIGIPARMSSSRFPGKPLCSILGMSMIEHIYRRCGLSRSADTVFIAGCDEEIEEAVKGFGGNIIMTPKEISRPGLRVAEAAKTLSLDEDDVVVVVQGDEPLVRPEMVDVAVKPLVDDSKCVCVNLMAEASREEWLDPNEIKVVTDLDMNAVYMSRSPIPSEDHEEQPAIVWKQVCIMPFRWHFMKRFNDKLEPTPLEKAESIEMLRAIQHGYKVKMVPSPYLTKSVDTEDDRRAVEKIMKEDPIFRKYANGESN
jgi:3-deoxy-manno-octulosonate cytidylyltransferase (CMP-KDO synthetase)